MGMNAELARINALHHYQVLDSEPDPAFDRITRLAAKISDSPVSLISLVDQDRIWFKSHYGLDIKETDRSSGICAHTIQATTPHIITDALKDPLAQNNPMVTGDFGLRFYAGFPLVTHDGYCLGALSVIDFHPREISQQLIESLKELADVVIDLITLQLHLHENQDLTRVIHESEQRFRIIFEKSPLGIAIIDSITGAIENANPQFGVITGRSAHELMTIDWMKMTHPDDLQADLDNMALMLEKKIPSFNMTKRYIKPNGKVIWIDMTVAPIDHEDGHPRHICIIDDITDKRRSQEHLHLLETSIDHLNDVVLITEAEPFDEPSPKILFVNQAFERMTGYKREEVIGKTPRILQGPRTQKSELARIRAALRKWEPVRVELLNYKKNGQPFWMELDITPIANSTGWYTHWVAIERDITERKKSEKKIKRLAFYDTLTGLANRQLLLDRLNHQIHSCKRTNKHSAIFFLDLDNFKNLNDTLGHDIGDLLLKQVAKTLRKSVRATDTVSRFGGDEFVIMLTELSEDFEVASTQARTVAEKIVLAFNTPFNLHDNQYQTSPSIGVSIFKELHLDAEHVLKDADLAMYQAKAAGKNTFRLFNTQMQEAVSKRATIESELRRAVQRNQFTLHYQPQVDENGVPFGVEALIRWKHPQLGLISPTDFIPIAEETGLIVSIGNWVLRTACQRLVRWASYPGLSHLSVSVNISARQFAHPQLTEYLESLLRTTGANPKKLKLELTETALVDNVDDAVKKIIYLNKIGIGLALDDFGMGYSSLSYLKQLPLEQIKIDQSFVRDIPDDPNDAAIAISIIGLAKSLNIDVLAEGVETQAQLEFLIEHGCLKYQGYHFSKPLPAGECEEFLLDS
jgi:diguanylate cyclase (GGDEF)-like protein/PAS domain S-box-containing protein